MIFKLNKHEIMFLFSFLQAFEVVDDTSNRLTQRINLVVSLHIFCVGMT